MSRRPRYYFPGQSYHVVQRGNNRSTCFFHESDFQFYLNLWKSISKRYLVDVHAYCLMTNHIHFLLTPQSSSSISDTMKVVGSTYARFINRKYDKTGTLWEGRHRSSLIQTEKYLLACYRYIELNPVRANMVANAHDYPWSSHRANISGVCSWIKPHPVFSALGNNRKSPSSAYRMLFENGLSNAELTLIRKAAHYCQPVADAPFKTAIEKQFGIRFGNMGTGRPKVVKK